jgi:hypothetical protein
MSVNHKLSTTGREMIGFINVDPPTKYALEVYLELNRAL